MSWIMVDVEADGPCPGIYSMIEIGAVLIEEGEKLSFHSKIRPVTDRWVDDALAVTGYTRIGTMTLEEFRNPTIVMFEFAQWLINVSRGRPMFISDNNGFDWQFVNYYFHKYVGSNPFGHSSTNLGSLYKGCAHDFRKSFKHLRKTKHTHNPVDDAMGNAEALIHINNEFNLCMKIRGTVNE